MFLSEYSHDFTSNPILPMLLSLQFPTLAAVALLAVVPFAPTQVSDPVAPRATAFGNDCEILGPASRCEAQPGQYTSQFPGLNYVWSLPVNTAGAFFCSANGQQSICVDTTQSGAFTLQMNYLLSSGPKVCFYNVIVNPGLSISALAPQAACPGESASFSTTVLAGNAPHTFAWTVDTGSGPVAIPGAITDTLLIASVQASDFGTYCVTVSGQCGPASSCSTLSLGKCGPPGKSFCTLTQGAYGSAGGAGNLPQINQLIGAGLTVGKPGRSLTFGAGSGACVIARLPANSGAAAMPAIGDATINTGTCQTSPTALPLKSGRFKNILLGQTITLALNTRLDTNLSDLGICETMVTQDSAGNQYVANIPSNVFDALATLGLPLTVGGLLELANRALAAEPLGGATLSEINRAVSSINEVFDECRDLVDCK